MIDLTSGINLTSKQIEQTVTSIAPHFIDTKDKLVETAYGFPNMMNTLWGYICTFRLFPTQDQFMEFYLECHRQSLLSLSEVAVKARVLRAYPSLVREIHFYSLSQESNKFSSVNYSTVKDVENGIDLMVDFGGRIYNISCYVETRRSLMYRSKKRNYRHGIVRNSIELPLDLSTGKNINQWVFFAPSHVDILQEKIFNYAWLHYKQHPLDALCS